MLDLCCLQYDGHPYGPCVACIPRFRKGININRANWYYFNTNYFLQLL